MDAKKIIEEFQDYLAHKLDVYEQAIYLYVMRHSRLQGIDEIVIGFRSAKMRMAFGVGVKGTRMSDNTCYERLRSLSQKGYLKILGTERNGTRIHLLLPSEIDGLIPTTESAPPLSLEEIDFFDILENRPLILQRESYACFYCRLKLTNLNYVIEHVISRPDRNNSYRNLVAACRDCNNQKGSSSAEDFFRNLYRRGLLNQEELDNRLRKLESLSNGELKPVLG